MPVLPLFDPNPADPDAWHRVTAPGGYEWWYFDAEDAADGLHVVAIFLEGFVFHPGYLRRYHAYRRRPTRVRPPVPGEYPCAYLVIYEKGRILAQFMSQVEPGEFAASGERPDVRVGPSTLRREADGSLRLSLRGVPWQLTWRGPRVLESQELSAELTFRPALPTRPIERTFLSPAMTGGATHRWVIADPLCDVTGTIRITRGGTPSNGPPALPAREIDFRGRGYHDHNYGTAPIGPGLARWAWGRVLLPDRVVTFHHAEPRDATLPHETHLVEADASGVRELPAGAAHAAWSGRTGTGLRYPVELAIGEGGGRLTLTRPRVVDAAPFYLRLVYEAVTGGGATGEAFCEVAYPNRLTWPVLGRMIEMSIRKDDVDGTAAR